MAVARRLQKALEPEFTLPGILVPILASFGIACGTPQITADELISSSDSAMYESKQAHWVNARPKAMRWGIYRALLDAYRRIELIT